MFVACACACAYFCLSFLWFPLVSVCLFGVLSSVRRPPLSLDIEMTCNATQLSSKDYCDDSICLDGNDVSGDTTSDFTWMMVSTLLVLTVRPVNGVGSGTLSQPTVDSHCARAPARSSPSRR